ncbi:hypothetical protein ACQJBY_004983 [Aegilops geniculata]
MTGEGVAPHRARRVKPRRRPVTDRERGIDVARRNGLFAMPHGLADPNPIVEGLWLQSLVVYNSVAELMNVKQQNYGEDLVASYGAERLKLEQELCKLNKIINRLRLIGFKIRQYIMQVELGRPLNEPRYRNRQ